MKTFTYVEEYIEVIVGYVDIVTGKQTNNFYLGINPIINLARYDVAVLETMSDTVIRGAPLTEKQGDLAVKIILKYQRQLANKLVDVSPVENPKWRTSLRKMDYSRKLYIENDKLFLRFPYGTELIEGIRTFSKDCQGSAKWNKDTKIWEIGLTEYNLSWLCTWASANKFDVSPEVADLMNQITEAEKTPYAIELYYDGTNVGIRNAHDSMMLYIKEHVCDVTVDNLLRLVDMAPVLGFSIESDVSNALIQEFGPRFYNLINSRELKINPTKLTGSGDFESVIEYAERVNRYPVIFYEPDLSNRFLDKLKSLNIGPVYVNGQTKNPTIDPAYKFIHTVVPIRNLEKIPLIVSSAGMVFGGDKQLMLQRAEKVVYCAADVYNKKATNRSKVKDIAG